MAESPRWRGRGSHTSSLSLRTTPRRAVSGSSQRSPSESPLLHGTWDVLAFNSEVLAIHAAMRHTGRVLFFSGSGNNTARVADHDFGDVAAGLYTSVV